MNRMHKARSGRPLAWLWRGGVWLVLTGLVLALLGAVALPRIAGATPYSILTGSMRPDYPPGTLVVMKPVDVSDIRTGDVITYQLKSGRSDVVTHRVVGQGFAATGERLFTTRGDANDVPDASAVRPVQIRGELWYALPYLGFVNEYIGRKERRIVTMTTASLLALYAAYMFTSAARERRVHV